MSKLQVNSLNSNSGSIQIVDTNSLDLSSNKGIILPSGTTSQQGIPTGRGIRYNTEENKVKVYPSVGGWREVIDSTSPYASTKIGIPREGLDTLLDAAYYSGGDTWFDISGNSNNATIEGAISKDGSYILYNTLDDKITIYNYAPDRTKHTIFMWFKSNVALDNTTSSANRLTLFKQWNTWYPGLWINGQVIRPHNPPTYRDKFFSYNPFTEWTLVGQRFEGGTDLYTIENDQVTLDTLRSSGYGQPIQDEGFTIGYELGNPNYTLEGYVGMVAIYNEILSDNDIATFYRVTKPRFV